MEFKDRKRECAEIKELLQSKKFELLVLYGRRRVGKTELALQTTKQKKRVYFLATTEKNLDRFQGVCAEFDPSIRDVRTDYESIFSSLKDKAEVIIIDEFQNMIKEDKSIPSMFQAIVDTKLKGSPVKLILLGSSVSLMTSQVLSYQSPLYGRRTASLKLQPVSFFDLREFFPQLDPASLMEIYGFADGIPYYLIRIDRPFWEWLDVELSTQRSFLKDEVDFLMRYEFDNPGTYKLILEAIANGKTRINEMKDHMKVARTDLSPYLHILMEIGLVKKEIPVTDNALARNGRYYLNDNFLRFWFRFIYPNLSSIESRIFHANVIRKAYSQYLGSVFEDVARQYLVRQGRHSRIGKWWHKDTEIDIVATDEKGILFGECKWKEGINAQEIAGQLGEKVSAFPAQGKEWEMAIFARSFSKKIKEYQGKKVWCYALEDM